MQRWGGWRRAAQAHTPLPLRGRGPQHGKLMTMFSRAFSRSMPRLVEDPLSSSRGAGNGAADDASSSPSSSPAAATPAELSPATSSSTSSSSSSSAAAGLVVPLLATSPSAAIDADLTHAIALTPFDQEGKRFGRINDVFHNGATKGFLSIHAGRLHQVPPIRPNFNPMAERRPDFLKDPQVFASMVDIPVRLPWTPRSSSTAIEMWDSTRMKPLTDKAYQMDSVKRKRARKMNKHKHRKKLKETRFLRRKLKQA